MRMIFSKSDFDFSHTQFPAAFSLSQQSLAGSWEGKNEPRGARGQREVRGASPGLRAGRAGRPAAGGHGTQRDPSDTARRSGGCFSQFSCH